MPQDRRSTIAPILGHLASSFYIVMISSDVESARNATCSIRFFLANG